MRLSPIAQIRRSALIHNIAQLRNHRTDTKLLAVIKADAYGHGLVRIAHWLADADALGVSRIEEGLKLRQQGISNRIVLLEGIFSFEDLCLAAEHKLDVVIHDQFQLQLLAQGALPQAVITWLKIDTGMHRLGFYEDEFDQAYRCLLDSEQVQKPINLISHFSVADELDNHTTAEQIELFHRLTHQLPGEKALCNSAGILSWPQASGDWVRSGLALYGANPMIGGRPEQFDLKPVMTLRSKVLAVRNLKAGAPVGYGQTWRSNKDTRIAVIAMGYGDGYPRHAVSGTPVLINGQRYPLVGRVSMDMLTVEVGDAEIEVGDDVVLWGEGLPVEVIAEYADTIPYELLCCTPDRVERQYID